MKSFNDLILRRHSTRKFSDEQISQDDVVTLLKAALMSPTSKRSNCWQFIVVENKEKLKELSLCKSSGSSFLSDASIAIVVCGDPTLSDVWIEDCSIASIMIQLQAEDLGLGSCWVQIRDRYNATGMTADEFIHGILDIPLEMQVLSIIAIGHKATNKQAFDENDIQWEKVHIDKY